MVAALFPPFPHLHFHHKYKCISGLHLIIYKHSWYHLSSKRIWKIRNRGGRKAGNRLYLLEEIGQHWLVQSFIDFAMQPTGLMARHLRRITELNLDMRTCSPPDVAGLQLP